MTAAEARAKLEDLHREVDARVTEVLAALPEPLTCRRGCSDCCLDDLTVLPVEADLIRHHHGKLLTEAAPGPTGGCAFLDQAGGCRIYAQRPYICRTQGLPLAWEDDAGTAQRDICPLNSECVKMPLADLADDQLWTLGGWEGRLASLQAEAQDSFTLHRVPLRALFAKKPASEA